MNILEKFSKLNLSFYELGKKFIIDFSGIPPGISMSSRSLRLLRIPPSCLYLGPKRDYPFSIT